MVTCSTFQRFLWSFPDRSGHLILDDIQSHHDLGFPRFLFRRRLLLQLRGGRPLRGLPHQGHGRGEILVHHRPNRHHLHNAGIGVAFLFRRCASLPVGSCAFETAHAADSVAPKSGYTAYAVDAQATSLDTFWVCVCAPGGLRSADHIREDYAKTAESRVQYTVAGYWKVASAFEW